MAGCPYVFLTCQRRRKTRVVDQLQVLGEAVLPVGLESLDHVPHGQWEHNSVHGVRQALGDHHVFLVRHHDRTVNCQHLQISHEKGSNFSYPVDDVMILDTTSPACRGGRRRHSNSCHEVSYMATNASSMFEHFPFTLAVYRLYHCCKVSHCIELID